MYVHISEQNQKGIRSSLQILGQGLLTDCQYKKKLIIGYRVTESFLAVNHLQFLFKNIIKLVLITS